MASAQNFSAVKAKRLIRTTTRAGLEVSTVRLTADGAVELEIRKPGEAAGDSSRNEWDRQS